MFPTLHQLVEEPVDEIDIAGLLHLMQDNDIFEGDPPLCVVFWDPNN